MDRVTTHHRGCKCPVCLDRAHRTVLGPDYTMVQAITTAASTLDVEALRERRRALQQLDTVGPFLDPTGYIQILYGEEGKRREQIMDVLGKLIALAETVQAQVAESETDKNQEEDPNV